MLKMAKVASNEEIFCYSAILFCHFRFVIKMAKETKIAEAAKVEKFLSFSMM
jgi:hypothetical protein